MTSDGQLDHWEGSRSLEDWEDILAGTTPGPWKAVAGGGVTGPNGERIGSWTNATVQDMRLITVAREAVMEVIRLNDRVDALLEQVSIMSEDL